MRIDVRRGDPIKTGGEQIGSRTKARVVKNKIAPPFRTAEFDMIYGHGISHTGEVLDLGVELDVVQKSGSWYSYGETRLGQGRENAKVFLDAHPEMAKEIEGKIRADSSKLFSPSKASSNNTSPSAGGQAESNGVKPVETDGNAVQAGQEKDEDSRRYGADIDIEADDK